MKRVFTILYSIFISTLISCVADQGEIGPSGLNSLINMEEELAGANCPSGGLRVEVGLDINNNRILDKTEIQSVQFVCNNEEGSSGLNSLINMSEEPAGENCISGGIKVETGQDADNDGILSVTEIQSVQFVCQGEVNSSGLSTLIKIDEELVGENCMSGGIKIEAGLDTNSNGVLDENEVQSIQFVCNGSLQKETRFLLGSAHSYIVEPASTTPLISESQLFLFDISNYPGVDSIVYVVTNFETERITDNAYVEGNGFLELYDLTNDHSIANSTIKSDNQDRIISPNLIESFPNEAIDIGFRIYSENDEFLTRTGNIYLILYRNL